MLKNVLIIILIFEGIEPTFQTYQVCTLTVKLKNQIKKVEERKLANIATGVLIDKILFSSTAIKSYRKKSCASCASLF